MRRPNALPPARRALQLTGIIKFPTIAGVAKS
ncbi:hypothetical protein CBM2587_A170208 [Cupriavidus taiwanensis]|uniref:Uncharacterized protein n=1 Tax=Cupriavidus taiwanensis TaxID=164546 RepID=A0A975WYN0_9BURK|nr:hypothetical protein CBM2587_A170208 [Cupriavidus taiwanensis]